MSKNGNPLQPSFARPTSRVAIRRVESYETDIAAIVSETLRAFNLPVQGKTVLLKANLVGLDPARVINTHPAVVAAVRESFLRLGASRVLVGDGPALERDTDAIVESLRLRDYLGNHLQDFVDLNLDDVRLVKLRTRASRLKSLYLPVTVLGTDFVVSLAKMKTHHWAGVSLSLKNMFGIVPGSCYGWPKNILHWAGIDNALLDINSTVRPDFAIVDGIVGMEGNGPVQGCPKHLGVLVMGDDPVAVDASCARIMGLDPARVGHLQKAGLLLGHLNAGKIQQLGESIESVRSPFIVLETFQKLRADVPVEGNVHTTPPEV